jgi:hypothetical protein
VVCLCAQWCGTCRDYRAVIDTLARQFPWARFVWLDIEDEADVAGDYDVETFPTLLLADAAGVRFLGPCCHRRLCWSACCSAGRMTRRRCCGMLRPWP